MQTLQTLQRKIDSAKDLHSLVKTMKALAAVSLRQYEKAVVSLSEYHKTIEMGFQIMMRNCPEGKNISSSPMKKKVAAIIIGSEQGMVGQFNENIIVFAGQKMDELKIEHSDRIIFAMGDRLISSLERKGEIIEEYPSLPNSFGGITALLPEVVTAIEQLHQKHGVDQFVLFHNRPLTQITYEPHMVHLLPLNVNWLEELKKKTWPTRALPFFTMDWDTMFTSLIRQHIFVSLYQGFVESFASENASRLAAMQLAEKNIEERLEELTMAFHQQRQSAITEELLDIVAGFEVMMGNKQKGI